MSLLFWGLTVGVIGKTLLAAGVLLAHHEIAREKKIDKLVIKYFRIEGILTIIGLLLILIGYFMEIYFYGFTTPLLTCEAGQCAAALSNSISN